MLNGNRINKLAFLLFLPLCHAACKPAARSVAGGTPSDNDIQKPSLPEGVERLSFADGPSLTVTTNEVYTLEVSGGLPPYEFSLMNGLGQLHPQTGVFTAPPIAQISYAKVVDASGQNACCEFRIRKCKFFNWTLYCSC